MTYETPPIILATTDQHQRAIELIREIAAFALPGEEGGQRPYGIHAYRFVKNAREALQLWGIE